MTSKQQNELNELIKQNAILSEAMRNAAAANRMLVEKYCNEVGERLNTQRCERQKFRVDDIVSFKISNELDINFLHGETCDTCNACEFKSVCPILSHSLEHRLESCEILSSLRFHLSKLYLPRQAVPVPPDSKVTPEIANGLGNFLAEHSN